MRWQVFAIRYATANLPAAHLGLDADIHDVMGALDYFIWVLRSGDRHVVVDTGFAPEEGARRGRRLLRHPCESLDRLGIAAEQVTDVILTHLHYDHAGNLDGFPNARFHVQDAEMRYATGRCMCHPRMRRPFSVDDVMRAVRLVYDDRMVFHDGDFDFAAGLGVHLVGGHSRGLQVVRVEGTARPIVIASDALHLGRYLDDGDVFPAFADCADVLEGYRRLRELGGDDGFILPGHDPEVLRSFAPLAAELGDIVEIV